MDIFEGPVPHNLGEINTIIPFFDRRFLTLRHGDVEFMASHHEMATRELEGWVPDGCSIRGTLDSDEREQIFAYLRGLEKVFLDAISSRVSAYTNVNLDSRGWTILLGPWVRRLLESSYLRFAHLQRFTLRDGLAVGILNDSPPPVPADYESWVSNQYTFEGEFHFNQLCLIELARVCFGVEPKTSVICYTCSDEAAARFQSKVRSFSWEVLAYLDKALSLFSRDNDRLISATYMSKRRSAALQLALGQIPRFFRSHLEVEDFRVNAVLSETTRGLLVDDIESTFSDAFPRFVGRLLPSQLPICYLEGLCDLQEKVASLPWPATPTHVFTSNLFAGSEPFKLYAATAVQNGTSYVVGQHGNSYGVRIGQSPSIEELTCDRFLTWGWSDNSGKTFPVGNLKDRSYSKVRGSSSGGILWLLQGPTADLEPFDSQYLDSLTRINTRSVLGGIPEEIQSLISLRPHPIEETFDIQVKLWPISPTKSRKLRGELKKSRLVVFGYDSTGFLELVNGKLPTFMFASDGFPHVGKDWADLYAEMQQVGLIVHGVKECCRHLEQIWESPAEWWNRKDVQEIRSQVSRHLSKPQEKIVQAVAAQLGG